MEHRNEIWEFVESCGLVARFIQQTQAIPKTAPGPGSLGCSQVMLATAVISLMIMCSLTFGGARGRAEATALRQSAPKMDIKMATAGVNGTMWLNKNIKE